MIYDHIKNIGLYKGLSPALDLALEYIENVTSEVEVGTHPLDLGVKAVVSAYETSLVNPKGYEAHRRYADIQLAVIGTELIRCKPLPQVVETIPYDEAKDAARYADCPGADLVIGEGYFMWKLRILAEERGMGNDFVYMANTIWMRYAEVLLCGAEAHFMNNNVNKAAEYVNLIRTRAHLPALNGVTLEQIKLEKRLELFGEGTRMQDLLRWGEGSKMAGNGKTYPELQVNGQVIYKDCGNPAGSYGWRDKYARLPYPATEIRLNSEIKQNEGY